MMHPTQHQAIYRAKQTCTPYHSYLFASSQSTHIVSHANLQREIAPVPTAPMPTEDNQSAV